jgi:hypothetical protein
MVHQKQGETVSKELPLGPILAAGSDNIGRVWTKALIPFLLVAAISTAFAFVEPTRLSPENFFVFVPIMIICVIGYIMATGLAYRLATREAPPQKVRLSLLGLQWGTMEERYLISSLFMGLLIIFYFILVVFLVLVFATIIAYGRGQELTLKTMSVGIKELGPLGAGAVAFVAILGWLGGVWLYARVSLCQVASLCSGEIRVLSSAHLTKGRVLALLVPLIVIGLLHGDSPLKVHFDVIRGSRIFFNIISVIWIVFVQIPFSAGVFASIYQRLKPADKDESERSDSALGNGSNDGVFTH